MKFTLPVIRKRWYILERVLSVKGPDGNWVHSQKLHGGGWSAGGWRRSHGPFLLRRNAHYWATEYRFMNEESSNDWGVCYTYKIERSE